MKTQEITQRAKPSTASSLKKKATAYLCGLLGQGLVRVTRASLLACPDFPDLPLALPTATAVTMSQIPVCFAFTFTFMFMAYKATVFHSSKPCQS